MIDFKRITLQSAITGVVVGLGHYTTTKDTAGAVQTGLMAVLTYGAGLHAPTPTKRKTPKTDINP
jgi:fatty-acid desaturase